MPRPMGRQQQNEKSKNFSKTMIKLFKSLKKWQILLMVSLFLAVVSAILSIVTPNQLSKLTDTISNGIIPQTDKLKEIATGITNNLSEEKMPQKIEKIMASNEFSNEEKEQLMNTFKQVKNKEDFKIDDISDNIMLFLLEDIKVDNKLISKKDQLEFLRIASKTTNKNMLSQIDKYPKSIYNIIKPKINMNKIKKIAIILGSLYLISALFGFIVAFLMATISNNFAKKLRNNISEKINRLPLKYFDKHETGDVLSRITNDVDMIGMNMNQSLSTLATSSTLFIGSIIMMFVTEWRMAITAILASLIGFSFMKLILGKSQKYFNQRQVEIGNLNGYIEEIYSGHNIVKVYNGNKLASNEFDKLNDKLYKCNFISKCLSGMMHPIMSFVGNLGYVAVCVVGAILTMNNIISFGVIVAFMIYVRLFTNPLSQIAQAMTSLQSTAAAAERVFEFLEEEEMTDESKLKNKLNKKDVKGSIEFKNVNFAYDKDKTIIKNFNTKVKPGQKIAIVGPTGAGKTTIVNLLMKFYDTNNGDIIIDNVSTKKLTRKNIHELFIMVLQDTWLFEGTIRDNIKFNKENVTDEEIWAALKTVGIDHFVKTLPGSLDAPIDDSDSISQGQKQLLTIARGMIEDAPFLILDEATSNVDTRTEELVQKAMDKLTKGRTSFIIAHRLSTIKNADLILVMDNGDIIEQGTHEELLKQKGFYSNLYNSQFETIEE